MSSAPLEIQVIYSASSRGKGSRRRVVRSRPMNATGLMILGLFNLAAASGLYYWTWWVQDKEISVTLLLFTPIPGADANVSASIVERKGSLGKAPVRPPTKSVPEEPTFHGMTATKLLPITAYGWLTLMTVATCALAVSSGSAFGRVGGTTWKWIALLAALVAIAALGWAGYQTLEEYGGAYPVRYLRIGMGCLAATMLLLGTAIIRRTRRWMFFAGLALVLSAAGSVAALYLGNLCGAIDQARVTPQALGTVFGIQSIWGWVLIPIAWRMARD